MVLTQEEFQRRCEEVFFLEGNEQCYGIEVDNNDVAIHMGIPQDCINFDYKPDMSERPQALDYLLGRRNDFND